LEGLKHPCFEFNRGFLHLSFGHVSAPDPRPRLAASA
jgi:hypothetical protein